MTVPVVEMRQTLAEKEQWHEKVAPPDQVAHTDGLDRPGGCGHGCVLHVPAPDHQGLPLLADLPSDALHVGDRHDCSGEHSGCVRDTGQEAPRVSDASDRSRMSHHHSRHLPTPEPVARLVLARLYSFM